MTTTTSPAPSPSVPAATAAPLPLPPHYRGTHWLLGALPEFDKDELGTLVRARARCGDTSHFRFGHMNAVLVSHPRDVQRVLSENARNYTKATITYELLRLMLGNGLVTSLGEFWLRQRRTAQPAFTREKVAAFESVMVRAADAWGDRLGNVAQARGTVDMAAEMSGLTLRIAGETLFHRDLGAEANTVWREVKEGMEYMDYRIAHPFALPAWVPTARNRRFNTAMTGLRALVDDIVEERRTAPSAEPDLLQMLMDARDPETGEAMTDQQLRDEVLTMLLAGHETTAMALAWALYHLSLHPEVDRALRAELADVLGGRAPGLKDFPRLRYTEAVLKETMRLTPPVWIVERHAEADDELGGFRVRKGDIIMVSPFLTHRHEAFWPNPEAFDPQRWLGDDARAQHKFAYIPFSAGQRKCIGDGFAMMEAMLLLPTLVQRFRATLAPGAQVVPAPLVTLRPEGLRMNLVPPPSVEPAKVAAPATAAPSACPYH